MRNMYLAYVLVPGTELPKPLEFPTMREIKVSYYLNEVTGNHQDWGLAVRGTNH